MPVLDGLPHVEDMNLPGFRIVTTDGEYVGAMNLLIEGLMDLEVVVVEKDRSRPTACEPVEYPVP